MSLSAFFNSSIGMYVSQAFCHSVVASIISDQAVRAWNVAEPEIRQRFRVIAVLVPVISFPLYQAFDPDRSSVPFRMEAALFDINRWLNMEIGGIVPVGALFLALLALTSLIFVFQEMVPILLHAREAKTMEQEGARRENDRFIEASSRALFIAVPDILVIDEDELIIYSTTGRKPAVFLSTGLVASLTPDELQVSLAHELAHIARSRRPVLLAVFILRVIMFFNPVSLVEFRRAVRNEEKICDDIAVSLTNRPDALADALKKFLPVRKAVDVSAEKKSSLFTSVPLEEYSHGMQLESRIERLGARPQRGGGRWVLFGLTILIVMLINYFIV